MFPLHFHPRQRTPQEIQQAQGAAYAKELKAYLKSLPPEARATFWAEIEGKEDSQDKPKPSSK
jgi:hypothetical protein